jgi:fructose-1,6-bisphosphatase/inositol monophosphatase family enzyme/GNAT superfamily N-acetyltransferase
MLGDGIVVRPAEAGDDRAVARLVEAMGGHGREPGRPEAVRRASRDPRVRALVAETGGEVVGYGEVHSRPSVLHGGQEGWLAVLAVAPDWRGRAVGTRLLAALDAEAARMGCTALAVETSTWRCRAHGFYRVQGFREEPAARRFRRHICSDGSAGSLEEAFLAQAAAAATAVAAAVAGLEDAGTVGVGADGAPTKAADRAAEEAALLCLARLGLPVLSEEAGLLGGTLGRGDAWVALDPLDGTRNYIRGLPPFAVAMGLVVEGAPRAGLVADLSSGRRWWAAAGSGAFVDGRPARPRPGGLLGVPSPPPEGHLPVPAWPAGFERVRVSGCTSVDLCRVADGSLGAFADLSGRAVHVQDLAGPLAILLEAGATVVGPDGGLPPLAPNPATGLAVVAAATRAEADALRAGLVAAAR